ncbi:hypothetical protein I7I53_05991 [Histoplasma capsulatum var. duboisii H88]|uniref:Secreted protein n=1 Tax=Ajellomyces capsulatus (strain H88) TaxID=544711 RepID=A0A8A1LGE2_AJEC8|nr:hypothetical protein I7I53_05991 [Histoplasma capsulatum var. duboisii H88]
MSNRPAISLRFLLLFEFAIIRSHFGVSFSLRPLAIYIHTQYRSNLRTQPGDTSMGFPARAQRESLSSNPFAPKM